MQLNGVGLRGLQRILGIKGGFQQPLGCFRQPDPPTHPVEQANAEPALGLPDLMAGGRLRQAKRCGGRTELAVPAYGNQQLVVPAIKVSHMRI